MKKLQVLGTGCAKCQQLTLHTAQAAESLGIEYELEKVTEIAQIMSFGVMATPALVIDGVVKVVGKVPTVEHLKQLLA
jgi:small redox-active disulfide protein 2